MPVEGTPILPLRHSQHLFISTSMKSQDSTVSSGAASLAGLHTVLWAFSSSFWFLTTRFHVILIFWASFPLLQIFHSITGTGWFLDCLFLESRLRKHVKQTERGLIFHSRYLVYSWKQKKNLSTPKSYLLQKMLKRCKLVTKGDY